MDLELKGKTAIITGGSRGIGKAVGREFGLEGMNVALVARGQGGNRPEIGRGDRRELHHHRG